MTPEQFDAAAQRTRLQDRKLSAARLVLVDGLGKSEAARESGMQPSAVWDAVARIEREHRSIVGCPPGWVVLTICVPPHGAEEDAIREIERRAWRAAGLLVG